MIRTSPIARTGTLKRKAPLPRESAPAVGKPRTKKCANRACRAPYQVDAKRPWKNWCSDDCAVVIAVTKLDAQKAKKQRAERQDTKAKLIALEPLEYFLKKAERACNAYIRARDAGQGCISCGRHDADVWNAGHFISVGANRTLRFDEDNIHLQCARPCNKDKGGNIHEYRKGLVKKIGPERLARLDGWHEPVKMTREKAEGIERYYKDKLKKLKETA